MTLSAADFDYLRNLIRSKSGISLSDDKVYLIESRLLPLARSHSFKDIGELTSKIKATNDQELITELIEAMTTNETSFFRDLKPFQLFEKEVLPYLVENNPEKKIKIWCAASSTGQEPYSLAMTAKENAFKYPGVKFDFQATDIDKKILAKAENGMYTQFEIQRGLPINLLMKYFEQQESYGDKWRIKAEIREMVQYRYLNLLENYTLMGKFDAIFCRNVLIYFEREMKSEILNKLANCLKPHGVLLLGSSETITDLSDRYKPFKEHRAIHALK